MSNFNFETEIEHHLNIVRSLQKPSGVFTASAHNVQTGYDKAWLRDIYFMTLGFLETGEMPIVQKVAKALLTVFVKHKDKINWAIQNKTSRYLAVYSCSFQSRNF
jgi:GH15 family glucan-1,4-alpha-glucosidase